MEREVSYSVTIGVTLIGIAALLNIIWFTVVLGKEIQSGSGEKISEINQGITKGYVDDLARYGSGVAIPAAAAHKIFRTYESEIIETACGTNGKVTHLQTEGSCLGDDLSGKVQLELVAVDGGYIAFVHDEECTWASGIDTDPHPEAFEQLKRKYGISTGW